MSGFLCNLCNVHLNSHSQFVAHQHGRKHLQKLKPGDLKPTPVVEPSKRLYGTFIRPAAEITETENTAIENSTQSQQLVPPLSPEPPQKSESATQAQQLVPPLPPEPPQKSESPPPPPPPPPVPLEPSESSSVLFAASGASSLQTKTTTSFPLNTPINQAVLDNALGKLPKKRKIYTGRCEICKLDFNSESQSQAHFGGSKHAKKMKQMVMLQTGDQMCEYCGVPYNSELQKSQHLNGESHKKRLALLKLETSNTSTGHGNPVSTVTTHTVHVEPVNGPTIDSETVNTAVNKSTGNSGTVTVSSEGADFGSCEYCAVEYNSTSHRYLHLNSKKHKRHVALAKGVLPENMKATTDNTVRKQTFFTCQFCGVMLNSLQQLEAHRQGQKHKDSVNKHKLQGRKVDESEVTTI